MTEYTYSIFDENGNLFADFQSPERAISWIASNEEQFLNEDIALVVFDETGDPVVALVDSRKAN